MKKIKYVFTIILLVVQSCVYIKMNHFDQDDKLWINSYNEGDTVLFRSKDNCDTLVVEKIYYSDSYLPFHSSTARNVMNAYSYVEMKVLHKFKTITCILALEKIDDDTLIRINFNDKMEKENKSDIALNHMKIGTSDYEDVFLCTGKSSIYSQKEIECYYWSKSKGLIQYKYSNGDVYTLSDK